MQTSEAPEKSPRRGRPESEFTASRHVYEPHRTGLPNYRIYFRELWRRREFILELSRTNRRAANVDTVLGSIWSVLNPLLLACVYYLLVNILSAHHQNASYFAKLLCGLFIYYFVAGSMTAGAKSITGGGRLVNNQSFPRAMLPIESTITAFRRFLPTQIVYAIVFLATGQGLSLAMLWAIPVLLLMTIFSLGLAMFVATSQVYFRDTTSFLPYFVRIWLYLSPVIWTPETVPGGLKKYVVWNPLYSLIGSWKEAMFEVRMPPMHLFVPAIVWAVVTFVGGGLFFTSREREFAVRL